ncbi:hypothetical protein JJL56_31775 [Azospirillum sp. YIM DDC1]|uniref:Phage tail tape measure protein n=1 Tax=Azospirillum aestuarii TaxID=2802052 RepID=A0ABS1I8P9_9PROT|nr:hypothetical protein [Azospirillum aestuarii]MBK4723432.1 hypothetical protein [Azospirillum aestuarii]
MSKLGQALSGVAADAFNNLDSKARGALENLVSSGRISAEDAVLGLRAMATNATATRYGRERPRDQEDAERLTASGSMLDKQRALNERMGAAREAFGQAFAGLQKAQERGELSMEQMQEGLRPAQEKFDAELAAINEERAAISGSSSLEVGFAKNVKGFNSAMASMISEDGFTEAFSEKGNAAAQKLQELGFNKQVYGNAFENFAATVDIPGVGRKAGAKAPEDPPAAATPPAAPEASTTVAASNTAAAPATAQATASAQDTGAAKPKDDPGNAQAALSMLQSALASGTQKTGNAGVLGSLSGEHAGTRDALSSGLLEALKAGSGKGKTDGTTSV